MSLLVLALTFTAVVLLIHACWLIWGYRWRTARGLAERWRRLSRTKAGPQSQRSDGRPLDEGRGNEASGRSTLAGRGTPGSRSTEYTLTRVASGLGRIPPVRWLDQRLREADAEIDAVRALVSAFVLSLAAMLVGMVLRVPYPALFLMASLIIVMPFLNAARLARRRVERLQHQLGDAVDLIARALRAGHALASALKMVADQSPAPISKEFSIACEQIGFGVPTDEALRELASRSRSDDVRYFVIAVLLQRETGGNLAELLDNIAALVRQRQQLRQSVRALSAEGRLSAWILGLLPFGLAAAISVVNPDLVAILWIDPVGRALSAASILMMVFGILTMRALIQVRA